MACKLTKIPDTPDFKAATGKKIKLFTKDVVGTILMEKAEYGGKKLIPEGQAVSSIEFEALAGDQTLTITFVFSESINGRGELREKCDDNESQLIRKVPGHEPLQIISIRGN